MDDPGLLGRAETIGDGGTDLRRLAPAQSTTEYRGHSNTGDTAELLSGCSPDTTSFLITTIDSERGDRIHNAISFPIQGTLLNS